MSCKAMKLIEPYFGKMQCRVCGSEHYASLKRGGGYHYGSWQCVNKCKVERKDQKNQKEPENDNNK
ncbi:MAG: hypothetical protein WAX69_11525 [Victivallales bacterium]